MTVDPEGGRPVIDVERLVEELRSRVAVQRAAGGYGDLLAEVSLEMPAPEAPVRWRPELAYSSKPLVGPLITAVKKTILRLLFHPFDDLARQVSASSAELRRDSAEHRRWSEEAYESEATARQRVQEDVQGLMHRIEGLERDLGALQLGPRLARLERSARRPAAATGTSGAGAASPGAIASVEPGGAPIDYLAFEARFRGSEETIGERQRAYLGVLGGLHRVVDLGCGRGELVAMLREAGVDAYGVEVEPDFVELLGERGVPVVAADAIGHVEGLAAGSVDGIVASHVVEHIPPEALRRLVDAAFRVLPPGGALVMETPNPESLVAGSINFHRDPTHLRPVHPDTLAFLCESAGFAAVEVRRMSPVPASEMLPARAPGDGALPAHVDGLVERLNRLLYGFQDYAVVARR